MSCSIDNTIRVVSLLDETSPLWTELPLLKKEYQFKPEDVDTELDDESRVFTHIMKDEIPECNKKFIDFLNEQQEKFFRGEFDFDMEMFNQGIILIKIRE